MQFTNTVYLSNFKKKRSLWFASVRNTKCPDVIVSVSSLLSVLVGKKKIAKPALYLEQSRAA